MPSSDISIIFPSFAALEKAMLRHGVDLSIMPIDDIFAAIARKLNELEPRK